MRRVSIGTERGKLTLRLDVYWSCGEADNLYVPGFELMERLKKEGHPDAVMNTIARAAHAFDKKAVGPEGSSKNDRKWSMYKGAGDMIERAQRSAGQ